MKKTEFICIVLTCMLGVMAVKSSEIQRDLSDNLIRMHIVANSNSKEDQKIKLCVRDNVIMKKDLTLKEAEKMANSVLKEKSAEYGATACYERCFVPEKEYKNIALPEGMYNCIKITLGEGKGENWWCIAYPPLCFTEAVSGRLSDDGKQILKERLSAEAMETIIAEGGVNFKFKTVEEMQKLIRFLSKY